MNTLSVWFKRPGMPKAVEKWILEGHLKAPVKRMEQAVVCPTRTIASDIYITSDLNSPMQYARQGLRFTSDTDAVFFKMHWADVLETDPEKHPGPVHINPLVLKPHESFDAAYAAQEALEGFETIEEAVETASRLAQQFPHMWWYADQDYNNNDEDNGKPFYVRFCWGPCSDAVNFVPEIER